MSRSCRVCGEQLPAKDRLGRRSSRITCSDRCRKRLQRAKAAAGQVRYDAPGQRLLQWAS